MLSLISHRPLPIAWLLLSKQPARFMTAILGVAFAGILILVQLAIQDALYNSSIAIVKKFDAELVMISQKSASLTGLAPFAQPRLANAFTTESVQEVYPIRWRYVNWRLPGERLARLAIAIGINPDLQFRIFLFEHEGQLDLQRFGELCRRLRRQLGRLDQLNLRVHHRRG